MRRAAERSGTCTMSGFEPGAALGGEDAYHRRLVGGVCGKPVDGFGGNGHQPAIPQKPCGARDAVTVGGEDQGGLVGHSLRNVGVDRGPCCPIALRYGHAQSGPDRGSVIGPALQNLFAGEPREKIMPYRAPVSEFLFCLEHVGGFSIASPRPSGSPRPRRETVAAMLTEAGRICEEGAGGRSTARATFIPRDWENGVVRTSPGFGDGWRAIAEAGFVALAADAEHGGLGMPMAVTSSVNEMIAGGCPRAATRAPDEPGPDRGAGPPRERRPQGDLPAEASCRGEWNATMNLTESQAGSDVGAIRSRAEPKGDGTYAVTGQKIYISWGDNDFHGKYHPPRACAPARRALGHQGDQPFPRAQSACPMPTATPVSPTR